MNFYTFFFFIFLFYSIIFHEIAHGYAAYLFGDNTAFLKGRLSLNPLKHIDFFGSIILPFLSFYLIGIPFGYAKPVPVNLNNVKNNKYAEFVISSAGILTNFFICLISFLIFKISLNLNFLLDFSTLSLLKDVFSINIFLGLFNLLPFPPADGFTIFTEFWEILKDFKNKIFNLFRKEKVYNTNVFKKNIYKIKVLFYNPVFTIISIIIAVNVFKLFVPFIQNFINYLFR